MTDAQFAAHVAAIGLVAGFLLGGAFGWADALPPEAHAHAMHMLALEAAHG